MVLIIGGAYQGKLDFALNDLGLSRDKIYNNFCGVLRERLQNTAQTDYSAAEKEADRLVDEVFGGGYNAVVCNEIGCGIVPVDKIDRVWREAAGRAECKIAERCTEVWLVRCGIGTRIK